MLINNRIIWEDNTTLIDVSKSLNDYFAQTVTFAYAVTDDYLYIGSDLPFTHRYFDIGSTPNAVASTVSVDIWDGDSWNAAVDVIDETSSGGASLAQDGIIRWSTDRYETWCLEQSSEDIPALSTLKIYNKYWARLSWSASLTAGTILNYIGHKFSADTALAAYYPDLTRSDILDAFSTGKTNWHEQHILGSEEIIAELIKRDHIWTPDQIMNPEELERASVHKCAEIIMRALGNDYAALREKAIVDYRREMDSIMASYDVNENGHLDLFEKSRLGGLYR
jgi:hypothetical protein